MDLKHLKHVYSVFERVGYQTTENNNSDWDVLWAHDYPFQALQASLKNLKANQKVNKFPGTGYITTKVSLATSSGGLNIPPAFRLPDDRSKFLEYVKYIYLCKKLNSISLYYFRLQKIQRLCLWRRTTIIDWLS